MILWKVLRLSFKKQIKFQMVSVLPENWIYDFRHFFISFRSRMFLPGLWQVLITLKPYQVSAS